MPLRCCNLIQERPPSTVDQSPLSVTIQPTLSFKKKSDTGRSFTSYCDQCRPPSLVTTTVPASCPFLSSISPAATQCSTVGHWRSSMAKLESARSKRNWIFQRGAAKAKTAGHKHTPMNADSTLAANRRLSAFIGGQLMLASDQVSTFIRRGLGLRERLDLREHQQTTQLFADTGKELHFNSGVGMRIAMLHVDDAFHSPARNYGRGKECLVGVFGKIAEKLETRIAKSFPRDSQQALLAGYPTR